MCQPPASGAMKRAFDVESIPSGDEESVDHPTCLVGSTERRACIVGSTKRQEEVPILAAWPDDAWTELTELFPTVTEHNAKRSRQEQEESTVEELPSWPNDAWTSFWHQMHFQQFLTEQSCLRVRESPEGPWGSPEPQPEPLSLESPTAEHWGTPEEPLVSPMPQSSPKELLGSLEPLSLESPKAPLGTPEEPLGSHWLDIILKVPDS